MPLLPGAPQRPRLLLRGAAVDRLPQPSLSLRFLAQEVGCLAGHILVLGISGRETILGTVGRQSLRVLELWAWEKVVTCYFDLK